MLLVLFIVLKILISIFVAYLLLFFVLSRLLVPYLNSKISIPKRIPTDMQKIIKNLKKQSKNKKDFLEKTYKYLSKKYYGKNGEMFKDLTCLFQNTDNAWKTNGFMPCNIQNQILIIFLIKSGFFKKDDIKKNHIFYEGSIHQYLKIKLNNKWIPVDIWKAGYYGVKMGDK